MPSDINFEVVPISGVCTCDRALRMHPVSTRFDQLHNPEKSKKKPFKRVARRDANK
jgi:hypothetical protein